MRAERRASRGLASSMNAITSRSFILFGMFCDRDVSTGKRAVAVGVGADEP